MCNCLMAIIVVFVATKFCRISCFVILTIKSYHIIYMFISFSCLTVFEENGCNLCIARGSSHTQPKFATKLTSSSHGVRPLCCAFSWSRTFGLAERYKAMTPLTIPRFDRNVFLYSHHPHSSWRASQCTFTVVLQYSRRTLHALYRFLDRASPLYLGSPRAFAAIIEHAMQRRRV